MSWQYMYRNPAKSDLDFFTEEFGEYEILELANVAGVVYMAVKESDDYVRGFVACSEWGTEERPIGFEDNHNYGLKVMAEDEGPMLFDCPESILTKLSEPAGSGTAEEWRVGCEYQAQLTRKRVGKVTRDRLDEAVKRGWAKSWTWQERNGRALVIWGAKHARYGDNFGNWVTSTSDVRKWFEELETYGPGGLKKS